jgi:gliding motility-associated-like protein
LKKYLSFLLISIFSLQLAATHIVGGIVTYRYLGANKYELTFKVYRDCFSQTKFDGDPTNTGPQSNPFFYGVFENNQGTSIHSGSLTFISKNKVSSTIVNDCVDTAQSCVEEAVYRDTIIVPSNLKSYTVIHQRCCRNNGINNIQQLSTGNMPGMTIYTVIPPTVTYSNNSAVFKNFPPIFICKDQQFVFDHSANDVDGDVLKYYLVTPLQGGTPNSPTVNTPSTVKTEVIWQTPYSLTDPIGGLPPMSIDEFTGILSCKPDLVGRFVVSVMVKEFRAGVCIDSAIRDFQFNVNDCDIPNSYLPFVPGSYDPNTKIGDYVVNCNDRTVNFVNASTNATSFLWKFGDPSSGVSDTSTLANPSHTYNDTGVFIVYLISYKVRTNNQLCSDTLKRRVRIFPTYRANFSFPSSPPTCIGTSKIYSDLSVGTSGNAAKWSWDFGDGSPIATAKNPTHVFTSSGTFNVKLTSESVKKCIDDTTIQVFVHPSPSITANIPNACIGQPLTLTSGCSVAGGTITEQRWTLPNKVDLNITTTYTPPNMSTFNVKLWGKTDKGCIDSQTYSIPVNGLPTIKTSNDITICYDQKTTLNTTGGISYLWNSTSELSNINIANPVASPVYPLASNYIVKGTDAKGCFNYDTVQVSFYTKPFISAGLDTNVCLNPSPFKLRDSVILNGQGIFSTFFWTPATGLNNPNLKNPSSKPKATLDYVFNGIDVFGCVVKDTVRVIVLDPNMDLIAQKDIAKCVYDTITITPIDLGTITKYLWSPSVWVSDINRRDPQFFSRDTVLYILYVENYCYNKKDSITVNVIPRPIMNMLDIDSICKGDIYQFNLNPIYTYQWKTSDNSLSSKSTYNPTSKPYLTVKYYYVTATDGFGCINNDSMELIVNYPPNVKVGGIPKFLCLGDTVALTAITGNSNWVQWFNSTYMSSDKTKTTLLFAPNSDKYFVRAFTAINCYTDDSFYIPVLKPIKPIVVSPVRLCRGDFTQLHASGGHQYLWTNPYAINDTLIDNPQVNPDTNYLYKVKISNDCFSGFDSIQVNVDTLPKLNVGIDTSIYRGAPEIELFADTKVYSIEWSPESLINTNIYKKSIKVSPIDTTLYSAIVTDANGCKGYDTVRVSVYGKNVLLIPTAFSPNGDGINDVFKVAKYLNVKKLNYIEVFNRWGEKIFSTNNINQTWDGTINGSPCPTGSYSWHIQLVNYENVKITKSGLIELIR